jgi:membrane-associated phospholipid phosphatase
MKKNKPVDRWNKTFFILYIPYFITLFIVSTLVTKKVSFLFINSAYSSFFDVFFTIISYLGDGLFIILLSLLLFFLKQKKLAVGLMLSYIISGIIVQVIKPILHFRRPAGFISPELLIHHAPWISLYHPNSFPSGHTTTIFAAAVMISLCTKNTTLAIVSMIIAVLVGYSRVYLGQHFIEDVCAGSFLGVVIGTLSYLLIGKVWKKKQNPALVKEETHAFPD